MKLTAILLGTNSRRIETFDERDLIGRVMRNLRPRRGERNVMRWVLVRDTFAVGSTVARALCAEFDMDPDGVIK